MKRIIICVVLLVLVLTGVAVLFRSGRGDLSESEVSTPLSDSPEEKSASISTEDADDELRPVDMTVLKTKCHKGYYRNKVEEMWNADAVVSEDPLPGMVDAEVALRRAHACEWLKGREYDEERMPGVVLVEDVYVVTLWKRNPDALPSGSRRYNSRVLISAETGEYLKMEIGGAR